MIGTGGFILLLYFFIFFFVYLEVVNRLDGMGGFVWFFILFYYFVDLELVNGNFLYKIAIKVTVMYQGVTALV